MNDNIELERLANVFDLEIVPAEVNGEAAFALADIRDTDKIFYGPVYDCDLVDEQMILDYLKERFAELESCNVGQLNLWDREIIGNYSDGSWYELFKMSEILSWTSDLSGVNIETIGEAAADEIISALGEIIDEIEADLA